MKKRMLRSKLLLAAGAAAAVPFAGVDAAAYTALVTRPVSVDGYSMRVLAFRGTWDELTVTLAQRRDASLQRFSWSAKPPFRLSASRDLRRGRVRARLGSDGYIDMRFEASGDASRRRMPLCGRRKRNVGSLTGTLRLPTGRGRFGTVLRHHFHAWLGRDSSFICRTPWDPGLEHLYLFEPNVVLVVRSRRGELWAKTTEAPPFSSSSTRSPAAFRSATRSWRDRGNESFRLPKIGHPPERPASARTSTARFRSQRPPRLGLALSTAECAATSVSSSPFPAPSPSPRRPLFSEQFRPN